MALRLDLAAVHFGETERLLAQGAGFEISAFRYSGGVAALRVKNRRGEIIVLPFKGQQIWRCVFDGRDLTMKSMFEEPVDTRVYLETYGAFFIHCGLTGMGAPGPQDRHALHGEMPNAPFQRGWVEIDETKERCTVGGSFHYTVAFSTNYLATSTYSLGADDTLLDVSLRVENLKKTPMDLMYLAHANFRPVDNGELIYSAPYTAKAVRVRRSIPGHITPKPGYPEFLAELAEKPELHHVLRPELAFDPEVAFSIDMAADDEGFAHALLKRPDGSSDYMRYQPSQTSQCIRWICRTPDQDAIGMAFPSTSEVEGYTAEKKKGLFVSLEGGATWRVDMRMGSLNKAETASVEKTIAALRAKLK